MKISLKILKMINEEPRQTPILLSKRFDIHISYVRGILSTLHDLGLIKRVARGVYTINDLGVTILHHELPLLEL